MSINSISRTRRLRTLIAGASVSALATALLPAVTAQALAAQGAQENEDVIVVSARRRDETLQDVPVAVTAATAEQLDNIGAVDITSVQRITPNATIEVARGSNSTLIAFIRGVGQQDPLWGFEPGVGVYIDDVFVARPQGAVLDIFDLERIEVLRGPQGTLYGRNTIGGAIKYVTKDLNLAAPEFKARVNVGTYGQFDQVVSASVPLGDTFAIGGAVANYYRQGFGENLFTGVDHYDKDVTAYRLSALWQPADNFKVEVSVDETHDDSNAKHGHRLVPSTDGTFQVTDNVYDTRAGAGDKNSVETRGVSLTAEWGLNDMLTLKSITAYREGETVTPIDFDALPQIDFDVPAIYADDQFSQEFQVLVNRDRLSGVAGIYYLDGNASGAFDSILSALGLTIYTAGDQTKENFSIYGDFTYEVTDRLDVSLGGRYTEDETTADVQRDVWLGLGSGSLDPTNMTSVFFATQTGYQDLNRTDDNFSPRVSVSYEVSPTLDVYASYSEGFKAGGFDPRARADLDPTGASQEGFAPETVTSYEVGFKGALGDSNQLTYAVAAFFADYSDQQITVQRGVDTDNDNINDTFVSTVFNAGKSEYKGLEVESALRVTDSFTATAMIGLIDAEIEEIISGGVNVADQYVTQNTPEFQSRFGFIYEPVADVWGGNLQINGSAEYRDEYNLFNIDNEGSASGALGLPAGTPPLDPEAYTLYNMSVNWTSDNDRWKLGLHGRNLGDQKYRVAGYNFYGAGQLGADGAYSAFYGAPRTFTASLEFRY
ncbi:TonB-dependent receptor [Parvularcula marina]|uniref:TonB-dependent receptor n=1 Tax=Parvularcula marina TaxID=2292771 RepID=UPI00351257B7